MRRENTGYSKRKTAMLPKLKSRGEIDSKREEQELIEEVKKIDEILKSDNLRSLHGFIFTNEVKNRLSEDLLSYINKRHRLLTYGFDIWSE